MDRLSPLPSVTPTRSSAVASAIVTAAVVFGVVLVIAAVTLWVHYGTAVFFEMIKSGIAACV
jgi:hypothetical protein